ncbi:MAG TPA: S-layer homology domain-containing protein, partial [Egicoccus sp.]
PAWSPDGRQLAFNRGADQDGNLSVWRMNADGTGMAQVTTPPDPVDQAVVDWRVLPTSIMTACPPDQVPDAQFMGGPNMHDDAIDCVAWYDIARGYHNDYHHALPVRRDQIASFLARLLEHAGVDLPEPTDQGFTDIEAGKTHADAVNQLAQLGLVNGTSATTYTPHAPMTRGQMATLLARIHHHVTGSALPRALDEFDDDNGATHEAAIDRIAHAGIATGTSTSRYQPGANVRRDQMATFLARLLDELARDGHITLPQ